MPIGRRLHRLVGGETIDANFYLKNPTSLFEGRPFYLGNVVGDFTMKYVPGRYLRWDKNIKQGKHYYEKPDGHKFRWNPFTYITNYVKENIIDTNIRPLLIFPTKAPSKHYEDIYIEFNLGDNPRETIELIESYFIQKEIFEKSKGEVDKTKVLDISLEFLEFMYEIITKYSVKLGCGPVFTLYETLSKDINYPSGPTNFDQFINQLDKLRSSFQDCGFYNDLNGAEKEKYKYHLLRFARLARFPKPIVDATTFLSFLREDPSAVAPSAPPMNAVTNGNLIKSNQTKNQTVTPSAPPMNAVTNGKVIVSNQTKNQTVTPSAPPMNATLLRTYNAQNPSASNSNEDSNPLSTSRITNNNKKQNFIVFNPMAARRTLKQGGNGRKRKAKKTHRRRRN